MPPKERGTWHPRGALPDPRWYQAAADRLDSVRDELARTDAPEGEAAAGPPADVEPSATSSAGPAQPWMERRKMGVQPRQEPTDPAEEMAALRLARTAPSNFNLQRQAVMICGRPVVVLSMSIACFS